MVDDRGAWCPHCGDRNSRKQTLFGIVYVLSCILTLGIWLMTWPFLPRVWSCESCKHEWKA